MQGISLLTIYLLVVILLSSSSSSSYPSLSKRYSFATAAAASTTSSRAAKAAKSQGSNSVKVSTLSIVSNTQPDHLHSLCFTQGLVHHEEFLIESCGLFGKSKIQKVDPKTGTVLKSQSLPADIFAEGLVVVERFIYMLTWKNGLIYIFDAATFNVIKTLPIISSNGEGWGLTFDGQHLIVSDGSHILTYVSISMGDGGSSSGQDITLAKVKEVPVYNSAGTAVKHLNELEYVDGIVYSNVWYQDYIVAVDPILGLVIKHIDLASLYPKNSRSRSADCLNGIAYHTPSKTFTLTGKQWPSYFIVDINISKDVRNVDL